MRMPSTRSGRSRPSASNRRSVSLRPIPASIRRVVDAVSINVELPALPEAKMEMRNEMRSSTCKGVTLRILAERKQRVKNAKRASAPLLNRELLARKLKAVEVADDGSGQTLRLKKFARDHLNFLDGHTF